MKRTNIYLDEDDREALRVIRAEHGIATDASAVRFVIRQAARELRAEQVKRERRGQTAKASAQGSQDAS